MPATFYSDPSMQPLNCFGNYWEEKSSVHWQLEMQKEQKNWVLPERIQLLVCERQQVLERIVVDCSCKSFDVPKNFF